jgi:hypothetical protein
MNLRFPQHVRPLAAGESFNFACHSGLQCFTNCCRDLELALTPYDVLRLKKKLGMDSADFLDRFVIIEQEDHEAFPRFYLTMIDDGRASCPFISGDGCQVYDSRPGACRTYPLGRAVSKTAAAGKEEFFVLLTEPHCRGFDTEQCFTAATWVRDQDLLLYNALNDEVLSLVQHSRIRQGAKLTDQQTELFITALYNLDAFRSLLQTSAEAADVPADDLFLLRFAVHWLTRKLFGESENRETLLS